MSSLCIVGFDPSMRNWGIAAGRYDTETQKLTLSTLRVLSSEKNKNKNVRVSSQDLGTAKFIWEGMHPFVNGADIIFVEVPHGSQTSAAMKSYGMCIGLLGAIKGGGKPFFELSEREVKMATVGKHTASKAETIAWAMREHPELDWPIKTEKGVTTVVESKAEHMADAVATIHAGLKSEQFRQLAALKLH